MERLEAMKREIATKEFIKANDMALFVKVWILFEYKKTLPSTINTTLRFWFCDRTLIWDQSIQGSILTRSSFINKKWIEKNC